MTTAVATAPKTLIPCRFMELTIKCLAMPRTARTIAIYEGLDPPTH
jgi:hypothetical protein